ncbi:DUF4328 domain-containing protein [Sphingomonas hengshuiensis]|uniref:DUF4328 domain-containing protein n=1 Tax=Sphingomonas hengshuiensis TaxID=1609977 RepID=UPI00138E39CE|nr:DUF4328 domain-containing protein [Sphingomonas hengshuiensis]
MGTLTLVVGVMVAIDALATPAILIWALAFPDGYTLSMAPIAGPVDAAAALFRLATIMVFCWWIVRAGRNLVAAGYDDLEFSPASRIWWFAVPIANFFKPFQAMRELWNASHGKSDYAEGSGLVATWWALWLISRIVAIMAGRVATVQDSGTTPFWVESAFDLPLAAVAIALIRGIASAQKQLSEPHLEEVFA